MTLSFPPSAPRWRFPVLTLGLLLALAGCDAADADEPPPDDTPPPVPVASILLRVSASEVEYGSVLDIDLEAYDADGQRVTRPAQPIVWTTSDSRVLTVQGITIEGVVGARGKVTGAGEGQATITARLGELSESVPLTVPIAWHAVGSEMIGGPAGSSPRVHRLIQYNGDLIAGGHFSTAGGQTISGVARWDGLAWHPLGTGVTGPPLAGVGGLVVYNGELIVIGSFDTAGGAPISHVARWDGSTWRPLGSGPNGSVGRAVVYGGDLIFTGGQMGGPGAFSTVSRWDGTTWHPMGNPIPHTGGAGALHVHDGTLYAGTSLLHATNGPSGGVARWDGTAWHPVGPILNERVNLLASFDGDLIVGTEEGSVLRWNGSAWQPLGPNIEVPIYDLLVHEGHLYAAIASLGGPLGSVARWTGSAWEPVGGRLNNHAYVLAEYGGALIVGGGFSRTGATFHREVNRVVRLGQP